VQYVAVCAYRQFVCVTGALVRVRSGYGTDCIVQYVAVCAYRQFVCVTGALVRVRSGYGIDSITRSLPDKSTGHAHKLTISTYSHILHKTINKRKSAELNLVTAQSMAYAPPEDVRISGLKHVGITFTKMFFNSFLMF
jgi:hypothetical protein